MIFLAWPENVVENPEAAKPIVNHDNPLIIDSSQGDEGVAGRIFNVPKIGFASSHFDKAKMPKESMVFVKTWEAFGAAIGCDALTWLTSGEKSVPKENVYWTIYGGDGYNDNVCVTSGAGGHGVASSILMTQVSGPCKISYHYKLQTYGGYFGVALDGKVLYERQEVTGQKVPWQYAEFDVPEGKHLLYFVYVHPGVGYVHDLNGVRIDDFTITEQRNNLHVRRLY